MRLTPKEINHQDYPYKTDNSGECGKDRFSGVTQHSKEVVKKY
jgi:hypothetical protein